jgi:hypothetical protein
VPARSIDARTTNRMRTIALRTVPSVPARLLHSCAGGCPWGALRGT